MNILLIYPEFSPFGFWNYKEVCEIVERKYPAAPLGLITVAALLPKEWDVRLIDENTKTLHDSDILWADLVFIGGMLPQQNNFLKLINRVHSLNRKVVVGGPDPTSQPDVYSEADYLVLGEAEYTIYPFLEDLKNGAQSGIYYPATEKPDMTESPIPRYDLLDFTDYIMVGVQFTRGCPYNCEFCDIIELYGRKPRSKTAQQVIAELDTLYKLGYRGHIDFVDDNFIGHKSKVKKVLHEIKVWSEKHKYPFFFSTEASINLADDEELLQLMQDTDFRYVFIGIETADDATLEATQKKQNVNRSLTGDLDKIQKYGLVIDGGFIIGFDGETRNAARLMVDTVQNGKVVMAMVGLLHALPNTQLTRRLKREGRYFENSSTLCAKDESLIDQTTSGLNFITQRPREEIIEDFVYVVSEIYDPKKYFDRCKELGLHMRIKHRHKPPLSQILITTRAFFKVIKRLGFRKGVTPLFWRNILIMLFRNPKALEPVVNLMAMYIHFSKQSNFIKEIMQSDHILIKQEPKKAVAV